MPKEEKNKISHRYRALAQVKSHFAEAKYTFQTEPWIQVYYVPFMEHIKVYPARHYHYVDCWLPGYTNLSKYKQEKFWNVLNTKRY